MLPPLMGAGPDDLDDEAPTRALAGVGSSPPSVTPPPPSNAPDSKWKSRVFGRTVAGRYRLGKTVGEGGMGAVFQAEHLDVGKQVAIKIVPQQAGAAADSVARFRREARTAAAIDSEHVVHVFDVGTDPEVGLFLVMELLKGKDLVTVLRDRGRLDAEIAAHLVHQAAAGLERAHDSGIIHRDLKPANLFVVQREDGSALIKIVDFGVAKVAGAASGEDAVKLTQLGTTLGTPQYMSPEQARADDLDGRTDVYSLGAVLFELLTGEPLIAAGSSYAETMARVVSGTHRRVSTVVSSVSKGLDDLVAAMVAPEPEDRVPTMAAVKKRLEKLFPKDAAPRMPVARIFEGGRRSTPPRTSSPPAIVPAAGRRATPKAASPKQPATTPPPPPVIYAPEPWSAEARAWLLVAVVAVVGAAAVATALVARRSDGPRAVPLNGP